MENKEKEKKPKCCQLEKVEVKVEEKDKVVTTEQIICKKCGREF